MKSFSALENRRSALSHCAQDIPFKKAFVALTPPPGLSPYEKAPKIEVLGDGQQVAVAGMHPDTEKPYVWQAGRSPVNTRRERLPPIDEAEARKTIDE